MEWAGKAKHKRQVYTCIQLYKHTSIQAYTSKQAKRMPATAQGTRHNGKRTSASKQDGKTASATAQAQARKHASAQANK